MKKYGLIKPILRLKIQDSKSYKPISLNNNSSLQTVSMIPGDRKVAGCFNFSSNFGDFP
ncbi:MAG: hypothetical protein AABW89_00645 [Nanoarchaeota archaeon]